MEDHQIIALFFARDEEAIAAVSEKYGPVCSRVARNILQNEQDAQECVNDSYLAAWNTIPPENPNPLKSYILRLVRNISITKYHANTAQKRNSQYNVALEELENTLTTSVTMEQEVDANELSKAIDRFLADLDRDSRVMFMSRYWCADSLTQIGKKFGLSNHNVSVRLFRIREKLKKHLEKEGYIL